MPADVVSGFLVGLSSGMSCLGICSPYLIPFLLSEERNVKQNVFVILEFLSGRFVAYFFMGLISGIAGVALSELSISGKIIGALMAITGIMLFLYSSGITNLIKIHPLRKISIRIPFSAGLVSGLNICPPFVTAVTYAMSFHNVIVSITYFLFFFLGTAVYLTPFAFSGLISRFETARNAGRISGILISVFVIINGILIFFK
ncbi:MAG TPA: sulfite exporter TauE/SafE family protein [Candidatus Goldiibacteriota bacterium]|nr:sulfite exporter TauE/SafE family protein [Candidatus Goldiibacteriota bacterium]